MKVQILSDLHLEFHRDYGDSFLRDLAGDVLILAGDTGVVANGSLQHGLDILTSQFSHVVAVFGNHEYYNSDKDTVDNARLDLNLKYKNLNILEDSHITLHGQRFIGSTLWFGDSILARPEQELLSDFRVIENFRDWNFDKNTKSVEYLSENIKSTDIVITHHIPSMQGVNEKWVGDSMQSFYVTPMDEVIYSKKPKYWIYGHTHDSMSVKVDETQLICNPFGYLNYEENPEFQKNLVI